MPLDSLFKELIFCNIKNMPGWDLPVFGFPFSISPISCSAFSAGLKSLLNLFSSSVKVPHSAIRSLLNRLLDKPSRFSSLSPTARHFFQPLKHSSKPYLCPFWFRILSVCLPRLLFKAEGHEILQYL